MCVDIRTPLCDIPETVLRFVKNPQNTRAAVNISLHEQRECIRNDCDVIVDEFEHLDQTKFDLLLHCVHAKKRDL